MPRGYDEIGKHDGLKIRCSVELVGSNPTIPILHTVGVDFSNEEQADYTAVREAAVCK